MIVLDASVALRWVYDEPGSAEARELRLRRDPLIAPDLWRLEVASAIARRVRNGQIDLETARRHRAGLLRTPMSFMPSGELEPDAFRLATALAHPIYDCVYLALAERRGARLATADAKFAGVALKGGYGHLIELVGPGQP